MFISAVDLKVTLPLAATVLESVAPPGVAVMTGEPETLLTFTVLASPTGDFNSIVTVCPALRLKIVKSPVRRIQLFTPSLTI